MKWLQGRGVATVKGTIPGQTVRFVVSKKRAGKSVGRLKEVVEKSHLEDVTPKCPHFEFCRRLFISDFKL